MSDPDEHEATAAERETPGEDVSPRSTDPSAPNPYILAVGVIAAILVIFAVTAVPIVVRIGVGFVIVAGAAYVSIVLARRR